MITATTREHRRIEIGQLSRQLMLSRHVVQLCEAATPKQEEFLLEVLTQEIEHRERARKSRLLNRAKFPVIKSLEGYDFSLIRLPPSITQEELGQCRFMEHHTNLVCYGPVGTGKTHLAIALGIRACEQGKKVRFYTVTELVLKHTNLRFYGDRFFIGSGWKFPDSHLASSESHALSA